MRERPFQPCVYIMASGRNGTLYVGVTSDLVRRVWEHREGLGSDFVRRYDVTRLVWFEMHDEMGAAIQREKALKAWKRGWKLRLIESGNPDWADLWDTLHSQDTTARPGSLLPVEGLNPRDQTSFKEDAP